MNATPTRFWFRTSDFYSRPPFVLVGVIATSWEEALSKVCGPAALPEAATVLCIPPQHYFLSCNAVQLLALPDEDRGKSVVVKDANPSEVTAKSARLRRSPQE